MEPLVRAIFFLLFFIFECAVSQNQPLQFAPIFTDSMVLQQQREVVVWGSGISFIDININKSSI